MAAIDTIVSSPSISTCVGGEAVTPSDSAELTNVTTSIYIGGAGNLAVVMQDGSAFTLVALPVGTMLKNFRAKQVKSTGTTATNIVALW